MGKSLESLTGVAPEPLEEGSPDHGDESKADDAGNIDKLFSEAFDENDEDEDPPAPGDKPVKKEEPDDEGDEPDDPDNPDPDEDDEPDPDKVDEPVVTADPEELPEIPAETMQQAQSNYTQALQTAEAQLVQRARPVVEKLNGREQQLNARIKEIREATMEDGVEVPLSFDQQLEVQSIASELQTIQTNKNQLRDALTKQLAADQDEVTIQHNMALYPPLKKFEKEYRRLMQSGMDCSDADLTYTVCRQLRAREGGSSVPASSPERPAPVVPEKPPLSRQQIEQSALKESIERKKRGVVTAGAKSGGASAKITKSLPEHAKKELAEITKYFNGEDED